MGMGTERGRHRGSEIKRHAGIVKRPAPNTNQDASQTRFYNGAVQHTTRLFQRLSLAFVSLLLGLLAIGPFLHSHLGASVVSGFHMDGLHSVVQADTANTGQVLSSIGVNDDESPALGVAASLPNADQDSLCVGDIVAWLLATLLVSLVRLPKGKHPAWLGVVPPHTYQAGWPPPALAPPALNC